VVKLIKMGTLRWLGHFFRMKELDPCRRLTLLKPEGTRRAGKFQLRWLESVEEDLKNMGRGEMESDVTGPRRMGDNFGRS
jgi:hypothetical protein